MSCLAFVQEWRQEWRDQIARNHGRTQGLVRGTWAQMLFLAGRFDELEGVRWSEVDRLVFACTGNICRSPYAEARATRLGLCATSLGLRAKGGSPPDPMAVQVAQTRGVDLTHHRSRHPLFVELEAKDLLVGMEPAHLPTLFTLARRPGIQTTLLGLWGLPVRPHIEDPFGLSESYFSTCFEVIDCALDGIAERMSPARRMEAGSSGARP